MLPKVAGHIFHQTSRAAATAQNYALRNVLGIQPPATSGTVSAWNSAGSSSWGAYGAGPGGAKYSTGSRFYQGYNGAGRAVTQANGTSTGRTDDEEDFVLPRRPVRLSSQTSIRGRTRSNSLTLGHHGRVERPDNLTVLRTVQLNQTRTKRTAAPILAIESAPLVHTEPTVTSVADASDPVKSPIRSRRNSTSSIESIDLDSGNIPPPPVPQVTTDVSTTLNADASVPQPAMPPSAEPESPETDDIGRVSQPGTYALLHDALMSMSAEVVRSAVNTVLTSPTPPTTMAEYNMALQALAETNGGLDSLKPLLEVYNFALSRGLVPNARTYKHLISAICERDRAVHRAIGDLEGQLIRRSLVKGDNIYTNEGQFELERRDRAEIEALKKEDNFGTALKLFEALVSIWAPPPGSKRFYKPFSSVLYMQLMRSCALAANVDVAIRVFSHLERAHGGHPTSQHFHQLMRTYIAAGDIEGAETVFKEYRRQAREGLLKWDVGAESGNIPGTDIPRALPAEWHRRATMHHWNDMIGGYFRGKQPVKAISLLEEMLDSPAGADFGPTDVPPPCLQTYTTFVNGFISIGDMDSAIKWFERMLAQPPTPSELTEGLDAAALAYIPLKTTPRPDEAAWNHMLHALATNGLVPQLNRLYRTCASMGISSSQFDAVVVVHANIRYIRSHPELSAEEENEMMSLARELTLGLEHLPPKELAIETGVPTMGIATNMVSSLAKLLLDKGRDSEALAVFEDFVRAQKAIDRQADSENGNFKTKVLRKSFFETAEVIAQRPGVDFRTLLRVAQLNETLGTLQPIPIAARTMHAYYKAKAADPNVIHTFSRFEWETLSRVARSLSVNERELIVPLSDWKMTIPADFQFRGLKDFVRDWAMAYPDAPLRIAAGKRLAYALTRTYGSEDALAFLHELGPAWVGRVEGAVEEAANIERIGNSLTSSSPVGSEGDGTTQEVPNIVVDLAHGRYIDEYFPSHPRITHEMAWERYEGGVVNGIYPPADVIGRLIQTFGRKGDLNRVHRLYRDGQRVLARLDGEKRLQSYGWYAIEDQMIVALAHGGDIEGAHIHRQRIIDQGGTPSNDAYGALIQCVKETTDDSTNAMALWQESQARGVVPNMYLYNTIISKLSKARKADLALELFNQMKTGHIRPSSVTFGAVIAACCRVGDAQSAEVLFEEMTSQKNFKPRIPPYNTMIQFYTHIMRDRERALYYFGELLRVNIQPTAHTYKLLIDCYGTIEPVDTASMQDVFARLVADRNVQVQGVHWASLINAWGCVKKDLNKAIEIFDSIQLHQSTKQSGLRLPDAVTYESMINVLVTLRRTDLMPEYLERLASSGVHMTAYIANLLIKGFAANGDLGRAREIFESLSDPPVGVAAPNNHQPHEVSPRSVVAPGAPVYREPSTWEAMVRAELGAGNRDNAMALLQRVQARHFPQAVYQRISGIMLDDTVAPWSPQSGSLSPSY